MCGNETILFPFDDLVKFVIKSTVHEYLVWSDESVQWYQQ